jgi:polar amino acid transport system substrate-binding protein
MCILIFATWHASTLVAEERKPILHLSANHWEPYTGESLPRQGIATEIVVTALARAGYAVDVKFMPWSRALATTYQGGTDGVVAVWSTSQRRAKLLYSETYLFNELFLFYLRPGLCNGRVPTSLAQMQIGVGRDYDYSDQFLAKYGPALRPVNKVQQNLLKLQLGRIDMVLEDKRIVDYTIQHNLKELNGLAPLVCPASPLLTLPLYFGMSRDYPNAEGIIAAFNLQLQGMKRDGTLDAITRKMVEQDTKVAKAGR